MIGSLCPVVAVSPGMSSTYTTSCFCGRVQDRRLASNVVVAALNSVHHEQIQNGSNWLHSCDASECDEGDFEDGGGSKHSGDNDDDADYDYDYVRPDHQRRTKELRLRTHEGPPGLDYPLPPSSRMVVQWESH